MLERSSGAKPSVILYPTSPEPYPLALLAPKTHGARTALPFLRSSGSPDSHVYDAARETAVEPPDTAMH